MGMTKYMKSAFVVSSVELEIIQCLGLYHEDCYEQWRVPYRWKVQRSASPHTLTCLNLQKSLNDSKKRHRKISCEVVFKSERDLRPQ
jgi:hypothetical protein